MAEKIKGKEISAHPLKKQDQPKPPNPSFQDILPPLTLRERMFGFHNLVRDDLKRYSDWLERAYHSFEEISESGEPISFSAEWILDNYYVLQQTIQQIKHDLSRGFQQQLPRLAGPPHHGFIRIHIICRNLLAKQNYALEMDELQKQLSRLQGSVPLSMGEFWAAPIFLRLGLIEKLSYLLRDEIHPEEKPDLPVLPLIEKSQRIPRVQRTQNAGRYRAGIVANIIRSLRKIAENDWEVFFESVSLMEKILRKDPNGTYAHMDFKTRNIYRGEIEKLARGAHQSELEIANSLLLLCKKASSNSHSSSDSTFPAADHVGTYLIGRGRKYFEQQVGFKAGIKMKISRLVKRWNAWLYLGSILLMTLGLLFFVLWNIHVHPRFEPVGVLQFIMMALIGLAFLPPALIIADNLVNLVINAIVSPNVLPKLEFKDVIPKEYQTLVVIPGLIASRRDIRKLANQLEVHFLSNPMPGLKFALLTDFADADNESRPEDKELLDYGLRTIAVLNQKYHAKFEEDEQRFFLMHRWRLWNPSQGKWMGWERKRGKLMELNRFLRGDRSTSFIPETANQEVLKQIGSIRFIITVDADTILPPASAARLIGTLAHPLNRAVFDPGKKRLISGYSILQPGMEINPSSANNTWFTRIFAGDTGLDLYTHAVSDVYQDLFGEGIFVGKGIYDLDAMMQSVGGRIPENMLLSHDLLEGILGCAGLISDVTLVENYPQNYYEEVVRQRRWIRGDWQLLPWLLKPKFFQFKLTAIDRWKIIHNLLRSLLSPSVLTILLLGFAFFPGLAPLWVLLPFIAFGIPLGSALIKNLTRNIANVRRRMIWPSLWPIYMRLLFSIAFLPYEAYFAMDAILVTLYRVFISHNNLLTWTTAEHANVLLKSRNTQYKSWIKLAVSAVFAFTFILLAQLHVLVNERSIFFLQMVMLPISLSWLLSPLFINRINKPLPDPKSQTPFKEIGFLRFIARRTWSYFEYLVGPQDHWLPPDHYQEIPNQIIAHHSSPSNIGLYLTATIAAYDLGYLEQAELITRLDSTLQTLQQLERFRGHFLNWYNTETLKPLTPRYVSTVDSGNLVISLIAVVQAFAILSRDQVFRWEIWEGYIDSLACLERTLKEIKEHHAVVLIDQILQRIESTQSRVRAAKSEPARWLALLTEIKTKNWQDLSKQLSALVTDHPQSIGIEKIDNLQKDIKQVENHQNMMSGIFQGRLPWLLLVHKVPTFLRKKRFDKLIIALQNTFDCALSLERIAEFTRSMSTITRQIKRELAKNKDLKHSQKDEIKASLAWLDELQRALNIANQNSTRLQEKIKAILHQSNLFINEMDFAFLYSSFHKVFHIGFSLESGQLDNNYYDLLASEARIASLFAISRDQVPQSHWMHLNRPITRVDGDLALLSWSATMFEYLMPTLYFHSFANTLLHTTTSTVVNHQIAYARLKGVPWGISESGYYRFDGNQNYQYRAFGVPGLGFKRGLADDLVITPYASFMAIQWAPAAVEENIQKLIDHHALGLFGFYEAIDFTSKRLAPGKKYEVITEYMSHHQGMILLALVNYLHDDVMINRVQSDPAIQSVDLILQEQMPMGVQLLHPNEQAVQNTHRFSETPIEVPPWTEPVRTANPHMHLLSNGSFSCFISNNGGGFIRWNQTDLTRWRADGVLDPWGTWVYLQDLSNKGENENYSTWSAAFQPIPCQPDEIRVNYFAHMAVYRRVQEDLISTMEVTVATDDPLEIRRIHLINNRNVPRRVRLTSYGEVVLSPQAADARHPAFNKLFIESEFLPEYKLQIFKRRSHASDQRPVFLGHMLVSRDGINSASERPPVAHESDRRAFLGRENNARKPAALQAESYLSGATGSTLDPIFSIGREMHLDPHGTGELAFLTFASSTREGLIELAERYQLWATIEDAFIGSNNATLIWLGKQKINYEFIQANMKLLSALLYPHGHLRADASILARNSLDQTGLWCFGISGDHPIILLELYKAEQFDLLGDTIQAQNYLRARGAGADLVVLVKKPSSYDSGINDLILRRISRMDATAWLDQPSGIFIRFADQMKNEEIILLEAVARVVLNGLRGSFSEQINAQAAISAELPPFTASQPIGSDKQLSQLNEKEAAADLQFFNGFGGFSADGREYVIHAHSGKTTPVPWVNVIGYPDFGFMVTQAGSQTTWAFNSSENRLSPWTNDPVTDPSGEVLYLRNENTGEIWTPTPQPSPSDQPYKVTHGAGYSVFESQSHGLNQKLTIFGSPQDPVKIVVLHLDNLLGVNQSLTATYFVDWVLGTSHADTHPYLVPYYRRKYAMVCARNPYNPVFGDHIAFLMAGRKPSGFTTDRREFLGNCGDLSHPAALDRIGLSGNIAVGMDSCAALQVRMNLAAHASDEIYFILGQAQDKKQLSALAEKYLHPSSVTRAMKETHAYWNKILSRVQVNTPEPAANLMLNHWLLYQTLSSRIHGRTGFYQSSGAFGFRDQLQDVLALLNIDPSIAKEQIIRAAEHQFEQGDVLHWWHPYSEQGLRTHISDDMLWLPYVAMQYATVTGESEIWDEQVPFLHSPELAPEEKDRFGRFAQTDQSYSLFEHCLRAIQKGSTIGPHDLPLIGTGDWNDGFNLVGSQGQGESVWLAWFLVDVLPRFAKVCEQRDLQAEADDLLARAAHYSTAVEQNGWDGGWFLRGFFDDGSPLGSPSSRECQLDAIAQSWSVISGSGNRKHEKQAMQSLWKRLVQPKDKLCLLFTPPFDKSPHNPGYVKDYPPGIRENGGQYTHAACWSGWAFALLKNSERAWQLFHILNPIYHAQDEAHAGIYRVEPYVSVGDIYSADAYRQRGGWSWYTGSAAWLYRLGIEKLLGVQKQGGHLKIDPLIPPEWDGFEVFYQYKRSTYQVKVSNPSHCSHGITEVHLDGMIIPNKSILLQDDGKTHLVEVLMKKPSSDESK